MKVVRTGVTPVKGTRHEPLPVVHLTASGPVGDRVFCLVDPERRRVLRTVETGSLLAVRARWHEGVLSTEVGGATVEGRPVPTGTVLEVDYWGRTVAAAVIEGPWARAFAGYLGRPVVLVASAAGEVVYGDSVSIVTTGSLRDLRAPRRNGPDQTPAALDPDDVARFRATFVVDTSGAPYDHPGAETCWVGHTLDLGAASVRITGVIVRCAVIDLNPVTGVADRRLLTCLPRNDAGEPVLGLEAVVVTPGSVRSGADVTLRT